MRQLGSADKPVRLMMAATPCAAMSCLRVCVRRLLKDRAVSSLRVSIAITGKLVVVVKPAKRTGPRILTPNEK